MIIVDNFFDDDWANTVENAVNNISWNFLAATADAQYISDKVFCKNLNYEIQDGPQFSSLFMQFNEPQSQYGHYLPYIFAGAISAKLKIPTSDIMRFKANLNLPVSKSGGKRIFQPHVDHPLQPVSNRLTGIYYANDCSGDGGTVFFEEKEGVLEISDTVDHKRNRLVLFDGNTLHAGIIPDKNKRFVLNMTFGNAFFTNAKI